MEKSHKSPPGMKNTIPVKYNIVLKNSNCLHFQLFVYNLPIIMILRLVLVISLIQTCLSDPQFFHLPTATLENRLANGDPKCPIVAPQDPASCGGRTSQCWSPGVRDTDCPGHGLCCYDGCANVCGGGPAPPPPPPPPPRVIPVPHPPPVVVVPR